MLAVVAVGFLAGLFLAPPDPVAALGGLVPRLAGADSALLAVGMLGATVMPHAVYLHSALVGDRHGRARSDDAHAVLRGVRIDVTLAMVFAGAVNIGMLLVAASTLGGLEIDGLPDAVRASATGSGPAWPTLFALGLLASGLASTSVGGYAGAVITEGLLHRRIPLLVRRLMTAGPALVLLAVGLDPTELLIGSQVVLSFGIPFALVPLVRIAADRDLMRLAPTGRVIRLAWLVVGDRRRAERDPRRADRPGLTTRATRGLATRAGPQRRPATPSSASSVRSSGRLMPTTLWWSPSIRSTNGPPSPSTVNAPATSSGSPVAT